MTQEGIFRSAHEAVVFALNYSGQQYAMSPMSKALKTPGIGSGRGLFGLDGAAQAGMILARIEELQEIERAAIVSRCAAPRRECDCRSSCCSGYRVNPMWDEAIRALTARAVEATAGSLSHYRLRRAAVEKQFGVKIKISDLADDCGVARNTAGEHVKRVREMMAEIESRAWQVLEDVLRSRGVLIQEECDVA